MDFYARQLFAIDLKSVQRGVGPIREPPSSASRDYAIAGRWDIPFNDRSGYYHGLARVVRSWLVGSQRWALRCWNDTGFIDVEFSPGDQAVKISFHRYSGSNGGIKMREIWKKLEFGTIQRSHHMVTLFGGIGRLEVLATADQHQELRQHQLLPNEELPDLIYAIGGDRLACPLSGTRIWWARTGFLWTYG